MSALIATSVTYVIVRRKKLEDGRTITQATLTFGNGTLTYPTGGVPLTIGSLGYRTALHSLHVDDDGASAYKWALVESTNCLRAMTIGIHAHPLLMKDAQTADGATTRVNVGTAKIGANTGSDFTIAAANANGGVQNTVATETGQSELASTVAPAAQTLNITCIGF